MKKLLLALSLALLIPLCGYSQSITITENDSMTVSFEDQIEHLLGELDPQLITTGILVERAFPAVAQQYFDGAERKDENLADYGTWQMLYGMMRAGALDDHYRLPEPGEGFRDKVEEISSGEPGIIPLLFLQAGYNQFIPDALTDNLVYNDNGQLKHAPNAQTPFYEKTLFAFAPAGFKTNTGNLTFIISSGLFFSTSGKEVHHLEINFDDGAGWRTLNPDDIVSVTYSSSGLKTLASRVYYTDNTDFTAHSKLQVNVEDNARYGADPVRREAITADASWPSANSPRASGEAAIAYGCGNTKLYKPLIFVEGFDPDSTLNYERFWRRLEFQVPAFKTQLENGGYDLIYLNFNNSTDYIQRNALLLEKLIEMVNAELTANGSTEQIVVMGESMGGLVARYALRDMELKRQANPASSAHNARLLITLDTPHQGAYVPLGSLFMVEEVANLNILGSTLRSLNPGVEEGYQIASSPAARQMLFAHPHPDAQSDKQAFWQSQQMTSYPNIERVAIANGSTVGVGLPFLAHDELLRIEGGTGVLPFWGRAVLFGIATSANMQFIVNALPDASMGTKRIYKQRILAMVLGIPVIYANKDYYVQSDVSLENIPGGTWDLDQFTDEIANITVPLTTITINLRPFTFIPTVSALDINNPTSPYEDARNVFATNSARIPFQAIDGPVVVGNPALENEDHTRLTPANTAFLRTWIIRENTDINSIASLSNNTYNFGSGATLAASTTDRLRPITIGNNASILINNNTSLGFATSPVGPAPAANSHFKVFTWGSDCADNPKVEVQSGGLLQIGDNLNGLTGTLVFTTGSTLDLNGGKLVINNNSRLVIEAGATILMSQNSVIELNGDNAVLEINGHLIVGPNTTFTFTALPTVNTGYIKFNRGHNTRPAISVTSTSHLKFEGRGITDKILEIAQGTWLTYDDWAMGSSEFKNGLVEMQANSKVYLVHNVTVDNVHFNGINGLYNAVECHATADRERISNSKFTNGSFGLASFTHLPNLFKMSNNLFSDCEIGFRGVNSHIDFYNCTFTNNTTTGLRMDAGATATITDCLISGNFNGMDYYTSTGGIINL